MNAVHEQESRRMHAPTSPKVGLPSLWFRSLEGMRSDILIADASGRVVRHMTHLARTTGWQQVMWDARDDEGRPVKDGVYTYMVVYTEMPAHPYVWGHIKLTGGRADYVRART